MSKLKPGRPSPALIVAVVALVATLGGTAIAANRIDGSLLLPQSVGGGKLRQFTGGLLKKETLPGGKLKKDTVTGYQVNEDTLAPVPAAKSLVGDNRYTAKLGFGQSHVLAKVGPLTLTAQCIQNATDSKGETGRDIARILVSTEEANSVFRGTAGSKSGDSRGFLDPATPEGERVAIEYSVPTGSSDYLNGGAMSAFAPSGGGVVAPSDAGAAALNLFNTACTLHGSVQQS